MMDPRRLARSFYNAARGIVLVFKTEQSFRLQTLAGIGALACAWALRFSRDEWFALIIAIGAVLALELVNSVFERVIDAFKPRLHPAVRDMKDIMAGVVLVASLGALAVGLILFVPRLVPLWQALGKG